MPYARRPPKNWFETVCLLLQARHFGFQGIWFNRRQIMFLQCDQFVSNTGKFTDFVYSEILQNLISAEVAAKMSAGTIVTHVSTQMPSQPPEGGQETSATVQSQMSEQNPTTTQVATGSQKVPGQQPAIEVEPANWTINWSVYWSSSAVSWRSGIHAWSSRPITGSEC